MKSLKELYKTFVENVNQLDNVINEKLLLIKEENKQIILNEKIKLLELICNDMNLNFNEMKKKYFKPKELSLIVEDTKILNIDIDSDEVILDKIEHNGDYYYYDSKDKVVYDKMSKAVGTYKNNKIIFTN
jgi:hypothetical protein